MASFNKVIIVGNLTKDPELQYLPSGQPVCKFSIACNERYTKDGQKVEKVYFFDVTAWAKTAELVSQYLKKGRSALVEGKLVQDRWDDQASGQKRSKVYVVAERVQFLGGKEGGGDPAAAGAEGVPAGAEEDIPF